MARLAIFLCASCLVVGSWSSTPTSMKAAVATGAGSKEGDFSKVKVMSRPVPTPGRGQVLIRVMASSVNPVDWKLLTSLAPMTLLGPKTLGFDAAGVVEAVGSGCSRLKVGDEVWADLGKSTLSYGGLQLGAWAEFALADESQVGLKPEKLDFQSAAALPLVSLTDFQAFKKAGAPWKDRRNFTVVVTSGSGGTGTPAIQLAKAYGASRIVTAASPANAPLLKKLGATDVFDYHTTSIWKEMPENSVDIVYDNYGAAGTADAAMPSIRSGGVFVLIPGKGGALSKHPKQGVTQINYGLCDSSHHEDLDALKEIVDAGNLTGVVQQAFKLDDIVSALTTSIGGHVVGKLVIDVANSSSPAETIFA